MVLKVLLDEVKSCAYLCTRTILRPLLSRADLIRGDKAPGSAPASGVTQGSMLALTWNVQCNLVFRESHVLPRWKGILLGPLWRVRDSDLHVILVIPAT